MILYRIVKGHFPDTEFHIVHPRVPERIFQEEDKVTPRICLAKSLDGCLTALSPSLIGIELLRYYSGCARWPLRKRGSAKTTSLHADSIYDFGI